MRKKKVRWISRDETGRHDFWEKKPHKSNGIWFGAGGEPHTSDRNELAYRFVDDAEVIIAMGGLAKITIERQY